MARLGAWLAAVTVTALAATSPANASIVFDFSGSGADSSSKSFTVSGLTVAVTAGTWSGSPAAINFSTRLVDQKSDGLGADGFLDQDELDNVGSEDILVFTFSKAVRIDHIGLKQAVVGGNYLFGTVAGTGFNIIGGNRSGGDGFNVVSDSPFALSFGIAGVKNPPLSEFRVEQLKISPVPVPPALALGALALGGLGLYGRRQRRTAEG